MAEKIALAKDVLNKRQFENTVNTQFAQLPTPIADIPAPAPDLNTFFNNYQTLFYDIPKSGDTNSHEYLIRTSQAYIESDVISPEVAALTAEVNSLRQTLVDQQTLILQLTNTINNTGV